MNSVKNDRFRGCSRGYGSLVALAAVLGLAGAAGAAPPALDTGGAAAGDSTDGAGDAEGLNFHGLGANSSCGSQFECVGSTTGCATNALYADTALDVIRITEGFAIVDPAGLAKRFPDMGNLPITLVSGNAVATDDGMGNPIFPVLIGPPNSTFMDPETGLTLPGAPLNGLIQVGIEYPIEAEDPTPLNIRTIYVWFDTCSSGAGDCPDPDLPQETPATASVQIREPIVEVVKSVDIDPTRVCANVPTDVTYTYEVSNLGDVDLTIDSITDDLCGTPLFVDGDTDGDDELDLDETWVYECDDTIDSAGSVTNTVTVEASAVNADVTCTTDDSDELTISVNDNPVLIAVEDAVCPEETGQLCASATGGRAPYLIEWFDPSMGFVDSCTVGEGEDCCIDVTMTGVYTAVVTDDNGCGDEDTAEFSFLDEPLVVVDRETAEVCDGESDTFTATVSGGRAPYDVIWTNAGGMTVESCLGIGAGEPCEFTTDVAGVYTATATDDNGCEGDDSGELIVNPNKIVTVVRPDDSICVGETTTFCAEVAGGRAPYDIEWFLLPDDVNPIDSCMDDDGTGGCCITVGEAGTYLAVATDDNGCIGEDTAVLTVTGDVTVVATPQSPEICEGEDQMICAEVSGGVPPYDVQWFDPMGNPIGDPCLGVGENGQCCITVTEPGEYCAVAIDANDCEGMACTTLIVNENPMVSLDNVKLCEGDPLEMCAMISGGRPPYDVTFFDDMDNFVGECLGVASECCITVPAPGTYRAVAVDDNGCEGDDFGTLTENPLPTCTISGDAEICLGTSGNEYCGPGGMTSYSWSVVSGDVTLEPPTDEQCVDVTADGLGPFTLMLEITDSAGCSNSCTNTFDVIDCGGGEGCTPGYWKQPHHFDDWTNPPYDPDGMDATLFCDVFFGDNPGDECAFPGLTLLEVLSQPASAPPGPNQLNSLGRHTVAALLNAANDEIAYDLTVDQVISMFNDVFPGSIQDYNDLKSVFSGFNEQICDFNGNADVDGDGLVNMNDFLIILENWGTEGPGDIDGDGTVGSTDVILVLLWWGA